ncbi:MAG: hypothetical protein JWM19_5485 [Actinomycetia bacterium]|nr:hypothetical protein [Actinomycetes bacterium]
MMNYSGDFETIVRFYHAPGCPHGKRGRDAGTRVGGTVGLLRPGGVLRLAAAMARDHSLPDEDYDVAVELPAGIVAE